MKGKKRRKAFSGLIPRIGTDLLSGAVLFAALCILLTGCGKAEEGSSELPAEVTSAVTEQATPPKTAVSTDMPAQSESDSSGTSKTTSKSSTESTSDGKTTTKKETVSDTETESSNNTSPSQPAVTSSSSYDKSTTQSSKVTTASAKPANATATESTTSAPAKTVAPKSTTSVKEEPAPAEQEYHIYADGYVTKYDELKLKMLSAREREVYNVLSEGIWKMQDNITIPEGVIKRDDASDFIYLVMSTMPEVNYVQGTFKVSVANGYIKRFTINYSLTKEEAGTQHRQLRAEASKIIGGLTEDMTDYEKIKYLHDYIIKNCEYDNTGNNCYNAYGCLVEGRAVCEGYAMAMDYLCEKAGFYTALESGTSQNSSGKVQSHIWNKIMLGGKWYNFDLTWDDPISDFGSEYVRYDYFGLTDEEISRSHTVNKNRFVYYPEAVSTDMNYFSRNGLYIEDTKQLGGALVKAFEDALTNKLISVSVKCSDDDIFDQTTDILLNGIGQNDTHIVYDYLSEAIENTGIDYDYYGYYIIKNEKYRTVTVVLKQDLT